MLEAVRLWHMARAEQSAVPLRPPDLQNKSRIQAYCVPTGHDRGPSRLLQIEEFCFL